MPDNGIKLFDRFGYKLPDEVEEQIEARMGEPWQRPTGGGVGRVYDDPQAVVRYVDHLVGCAPHRLDGLRVVVDCAHGSASVVAPEVYRRLGARVHTLGAEPNGLNINDDIGSTHPEQLQKMVVDLERRPRHRPRRRRRPLPGRRRRRPARRRRPDPRDLRAGPARRRPAHRRHRGDARSWPTSASSWRWPSRASQLVETAVGDRYVLEVDAARRLRPRRRAVGPRAVHPPRHDRRRHADRGAADGPHGGDRAARWASSRR